MNRICKFCGEIKPTNKIDIDGGSICVICYEKNGRPQDLCSICHKIGIIATRYDGKIICKKCYISPKRICSGCGETKTISDADKQVCRACYSKKYIRKSSICRDCGKNKEIKKRINGDPICKNCYNRLREICSICGKNKFPKSRSKSDGAICERCYKKKRFLENPSLYIIEKLRDRLRGAIRLYSLTGKTKKSNEYGINYEEIIKHLGPCPGNRKDYQIDHIFPLIVFDFNNPIHIKAAFAPENHQWLRKEDNLRKNNKYSKEKFEEYLNRQINKEN